MCAHLQWGQEELCCNWGFQTLCQNDPSQSKRKNLVKDARHFFLKITTNAVITCATFIAKYIRGGGILEMKEKYNRTRKDVIYWNGIYKNIYKSKKHFTSFSRPRPLTQYADWFNRKQFSTHWLIPPSLRPPRSLPSTHREETRRTKRIGRKELTSNRGERGFSCTHFSHLDTGRCPIWYDSRLRASRQLRAAQKRDRGVGKRQDHI